MDFRKVIGIGTIIIIFFSTLFIGCYSFQGSSLPSHIKSIAVPLFKDQSGFGEPSVREDMTSELINLFIKESNLEIEDKTTANAMLECSIVSVNVNPSVVSPGEQVTSQRVTVNVRVIYTDFVLQKKVWERDFSQWGDYEQNSETRNDGITRAIKKITEDIFTETISNW